MRLALIGDIHGNSAALRAVLDRAASENVDILLVTGDLVGYYFDPRGALGLLAPWRKYMVRGNHEDMLASARRDPGQLPRIQTQYGSGLRIALETLSAEELDALSALPHPLDLNLDGMHILLCHGAPWDNDCYVYPDADADLMRQYAAQQQAPVPQVDYSTMTRAEMAKACKAGGIKMARTDTKEILMERLRGKNAA